MKNLYVKFIQKTNIVRQLTPTKEPDPVSIEDIEALETKYNILVPDYLRQLIIQYNGIRTQECYVPFEDGINELINLFIPLKAKPHTLIYTIYDVLEYSIAIGISLDFFPFAFINSWTLYVKISGDNLGRVFYLNPEEEDVEEYHHYYIDSLFNSLVTERRSN
jgi:hypothetical protein